MMFVARRFRYLLLAGCTLAATQLAAAVAVPALAARVTDLTDTEQRALEDKLAAAEAEQGSQLAVLLLPSTGEETIEQYGIRVAEAWQLGRKGVDDGVILIVAKDDRKLRIEVGYGLEGAIPDAIAKRIIEDLITPYFRRGDFYTGIAAGVDAILARIRGEPLPEPKRGDDEAAGLIAAFGLFLLAVFVGSAIGRAAGTHPGWLSGAGIAGFGVWLAQHSGGLALIAAIFAALMVLASLSGGGWSNGWRSGGRHWGGSFGGGSFGGGGFSGGGGGFGGGGASGGW